MFLPLPELGRGLEEELQGEPLRQVKPSELGPGLEASQSSEFQNFGVLLTKRESSKVW